MRLQGLFQKMADLHDGTVLCDDILEPHRLRVTVLDRRGQHAACVTILPFRAVEEGTSKSVELVRVRDEESCTVTVVSPTPSAVLAVILR